MCWGQTMTNKTNTSEIITLTCVCVIKDKIKDKIMDNPKATIEALLESEKDVSGLTIYPITIARYGLLEAINSPFVTKGEKFSILNLVPSLYIMSSTIDTLKRYNIRNVDQLVEDANVWSEQLVPEQIEKAVEEIEAKIKTMFTVAPEVSEGTNEGHRGKKAQTAG